MPNRKKSTAKEMGGPFLAAAIFCETIIEDKQDSALSVVRIIDTITVTLAPSTPPDVPSEQNRIPVGVNCLLCFKTGSSTSKTHALRIVLQSPSGKRVTALEQTVPFSPEAHGGANVRLATTIGVQKGGVFWMDVFLDNKRLCRTPLLIQILRQEAVTAPPANPDAAS